jgi:hypothetical protein
MFFSSNQPGPVGGRPQPSRAGLFGGLRRRLRGAFFRFLRRVADTDDAKVIQAAQMNGLLPRRTGLDAPTLDVSAQPYADLGRLAEAGRTAQRDDVILISARFRSGSTLLWNLFRASGKCTAYYEPFNERRWFDPAARGARTDPTHKGVVDYWREYEGLGELKGLYREDWIRRDLFMDADSWDPAMKRYVEVLIERAAARPVLQFNRADFRLPWMRRTFPRAKIVHLHRHPRDQWTSTLTDPTRFTRDGLLASFESYDEYYLLSWARDLKYHFPFLGEGQCRHPYWTFYLIWKLSYLFGRRYADVSLAYEDLLAAPEARITELFDRLNLGGVDVSALSKLIEKPRSGRWRNYADEDWFRRHEADAEAVLADFFAARGDS